MPKSNFLRKKNKNGATADFKRLKAKVGKRAPQAASHTDTSFKSKRVRVSAQSILHDLGDIDAVTARGQGVQELLVQLRHYSPASKRDALAGLKSVVDRHRDFAEVNFARLAEASLELAVCPETDVRKALLAFQETLLMCVSARTFSPFANLYIAYVVSAMTSLNKGVRCDSLALLSLLLDRFPAAVADRAERLAPNYATLLAADPASKKHAGRAEALQSLVSLFKAVTRRYGHVLGGGGSNGGMHGSGAGGGLGSARLSWKQSCRRNGALMLCPCPTRGSAGSVGGGDGGGGAEADAPQIKALASILPTVLERLREVWIEAHAAVPPDIGSMQSVVYVLLEAIASPVWTAAGRGGVGVGDDDDGFDNGSNGRKAAVVSWHDTAAQGPGQGRGAGGRRGASVVGVRRLLSAFGDFLESLPARSEAKLLCIRFVCRLTGTLLPGSGSGSAVGEDDPETSREVCRWLRSLPELLCRWGGEFPQNSAAALEALVEVAKHALPPQQAPATPGASVGGASPVKGKEKGKTASAGGALAAGGPSGRGGSWAVASSELLRSIEPALLAEFFGGQAFLSLPAAAQMDAISLLYHLPSMPATVLSELAVACSEPIALDRDVRSFVLEVVHHRRRSLSPSAYLGFLVSILTASAGVRSTGGAKRSARHRLEGVIAGGSSGGGGGKRRRRRPAASGGGGRPEDDEGLAAERVVAPVAPPTFWETVFGRDEVTGAVCNSLAMIGTRGGALLEALQPTLLQLLRHRSILGISGGRGRGKGGSKQGAAGGGIGGDVSIVRSLDEEALAAVLQGQRAAMACVLCCWEGLAAGANSSPASTTADTNAGSHATSSPSPLLALERPVAAACVWAMKTAGTAEAGENARGARLLRPVLVLVKRWPALLPVMLALIVEAASEITAAAMGGEGGSVQEGIVGVGGFQSLEPLLRCLQTVVRDPALQGQLRRRHVGVLRESTASLCAEMDESPLKDVVVQLRADVQFLGGGV
eukprot:g9853.t1